MSNTEVVIIICCVAIYFTGLGMLLEYFASDKKLDTQRHKYLKIIEDIKNECDTMKYKLNFYERLKEKDFAEKAELSDLAYKDKMTGCYNRNWLEEHRAEFDTQEMEIALVDLNGLKETNDTCGHELGDARIKNLCNLLKNYGTVVRLGGDEFLLIFDSGKNLIFDWTCKDNEEFSYGIVNKTKKDVFSIALKIADKRMYNMKKETKGEK